MGCLVLRKKKKDKKVGSKRPRDLDITQQRLESFVPFFNPGLFLAGLLITGLLFTGLGALFFLKNEEAKIAFVDYTQCTSVINPEQTCDREIDPANPNAPNCQCTVTLTLEEDWPVNELYLYYELDMYYQNLRQYFSSRDLHQLGAVTRIGSSRFCIDSNQAPDGTYYSPCGFIANTLFNDTINTITFPDNTPSTLNYSNLALADVLQNKFINPPPADNLTEAFEGTTQPFAWAGSNPNAPATWNQTPNDFGPGQGIENERLVVWMTNAGNPIFKKLFARIPSNSGQGFPAGNYTINMNYAYKVTDFRAKKKWVVLTTTFLGGPNSFLGYAYMVYGGLTVVLSVILILVNLCRPRKFGEFPKNFTYYSTDS